MTDALAASLPAARADAPPPGDRAPHIVQIRSLAKRFRRDDGAVVPAIDDVSLDVRRGELLVLLGPSGCGKTTLLRAVAGLEVPDGGSIAIDGRPVFGARTGLCLAPEARRLSMIFQSYALWPHMTASRNVAYPLQARGVGARDIATRVAKALAMVGIPELAGQYPSQMSGGQQQRVALARAIVAEDQLVLFDEPLSNVDAKVRQQLRLELMAMQRALSFAAMYVTHDQTEAMALGHRIAVLRAGRIEQIGTPAEVYNTPATRYVASFIGTTNELPARIVETGRSGLVAETRFGRLTVAPQASGAVGDAVTVLLRPEHLRLAEREPAGGVSWPGVVTSSVFLGAYTETVVAMDELTMQVWTTQSAPLAGGKRVFVSPDPDRIRIVAA
jgi:iron(III) transport system ATP-binding protein